MFRRAVWSVSSSREKKGFRIRRELREIVLFAVHNALKDPPFSRLDLVSCRNLLIYLNRQAQPKLMQIFHFPINPEKYLFLGSSESIEDSQQFFVSVDKENNIFQSCAVESKLTFPASNVSIAISNRRKAPTVMNQNRKIGCSNNFLIERFIKSCSNNTLRLRSSSARNTTFSICLRASDVS